MAGLTTALLVGGASLAGAAMSSSASKSAASTQAAASDRAAELQNQQFQQLLQLQMPGYNRGEAAAGIYSQALGIPSMTGGSGGTQSASQAYSPAAQGVASQQRLMTNKPSVGMQAIEGGAPFYAPTDQSYTSAPAQQVTTGQGNAPAPAQTSAQGQGQLDIAAQVMNTPGYQAQLDQGLKSIDRAAPLTGGMYSGRRMKALNDYGQNTFGSYYNDWMNRVGGVAGQGTQTAQAIGQAGQQTANNVGNLMMTGANARAQGSLNSASAWSGALGNIAGGYAGYYG